MVEITRVAPGAESDQLTEGLALRWLLVTSIKPSAPWVGESGHQQRVLHCTALR